MSHNIRQHLLNSTYRNHYLKCVVEHEQDKIMRVGKELLDRFETEDKSTVATKETSQKYLKSSLERMNTHYLQKLECIPIIVADFPKIKLKMCFI